MMAKKRKSSSRKLGQIGGVAIRIRQLLNPPLRCIIAFLRATRKAVWNLALSKSVTASDQIEDFCNGNQSLEERSFLGVELNFGSENPSLEERSFLRGRNRSCEGLEACEGQEEVSDRQWTCED